MADDPNGTRKLPITDAPLNHPRRSLVPVLIGLLVCVLVVIGVFAMITVVRYNT